MRWEKILKIKDYPEREEGRDNCCEETKKLYLNTKSLVISIEHNYGLAPMEEVEAMDCEQLHTYLHGLVQPEFKKFAWYEIVKVIWNYKKRCDKNKQFFTPEGGRPLGSSDFAFTDRKGNRLNADGTPFMGRDFDLRNR